MSNKAKANRLNSQINLRYSVLTDWLINGIPTGYRVPKSLTKARLWVDPVLGIEKIGSPSSFTTNHRIYGRTIVRIHSLIEKLNIPVSPKIKTNPLKTLSKERAKRQHYEEALIASANQYASLQMELDKLKVLYKVAIQSQKDMQQELSEANSNIQKLKSEIVLLRAAKNKSKVSSIGFV